MAPKHRIGPMGFKVFYSFDEDTEVKENKETTNTFSLTAADPQSQKHALYCANTHCTCVCHSLHLDNNHSCYCTYLCTAHHFLYYRSKGNINLWLLQWHADISLGQTPNPKLAPVDQVEPQSSSASSLWIYMWMVECLAASIREKSTRQVQIIQSTQFLSL